MSQQKANTPQKSQIRRSRSRSKAQRRQADYPMGLGAGYGHSFNSQVTSLQRLATPQRQVALQQIGQTQGNRHANRLVETLHQPTIYQTAIQRGPRHISTTPKSPAPKPGTNNEPTSIPRPSSARFRANLA